MRRVLAQHGADALDSRTHHWITVMRSLCRPRRARVLPDHVRGPRHREPAPPLLRQPAGVGHPSGTNWTVLARYQPTW